jgi:hypothetical protein
MRQRGRLLLGLRALTPGRPAVAAVLAVVLLLAGALAAPEQQALALAHAPPRIWLEPDCTFPAGDDVNIPEISITVHGHNFNPGATIEISSWERDADEPLPEATVSADRYGTFDQEIFVFRPIRAGDYRIDAVDVDSDGQSRADTLFKVPCPGSVTLDPPCADPPAAGQRLSVRVTGQGWFNDSAFLIRFVNANGDEFDQTRAVVTDGFFEATLEPPSPQIAARPLVNDLYAVIVVSVQVPAAVVAFLVPCSQPEVLLDPPCGPEGQAPGLYEPLQISGSGFIPTFGGRRPSLLIDPRPTGGIEVMFDVDGRRQQFNVGGVADDGSWGPVAIDPYLRPPGSYNVRVREYVSSLLVLETTTTFGVPCPPAGEPRVEMDPPGCGVPAFEGDEERRYAITIRGFDFRPGPVAITFDALQQSELGVDLFERDVGSDGNFVETIDPLRREIGTYEIHVVQDGDPPIVLSDLRFSVPCEPAKTPELTARCDPEEPTPAELAELLIEASGFYEDAPLTFVVAGVPSDPQLTDAEGGTSRRVPVAGLPDGPLEVVAVQRTATLVVIAQAQTVIVLPCGTPEAPLLRLIPENASPGLVVIVEGAFFPPGEEIALRWDRGIGTDRSLEVTPDANGLFRQQVLIFHRDFLGMREVTAVNVANPEITYAEPAQLLVVPGRGSPPAFAPPAGLALEPETLIVIRR